MEIWMDGWMDKRMKEWKTIKDMTDRNKDWHKARRILSINKRIALKLSQDFNHSNHIIRRDR